MLILQLLISGILIGGIYALISIGLTLIFGVVRVINFAHGEYLMVGAYLVYWLNVLLGVDPYMSFFIVVPVMYLAGVMTYNVVIKPILMRPSHNQILITVGLSFFLQNLALLIFKADFRTVSTVYSSFAIRAGDISIGFPRLMAFMIAMLVTFVIYLFLKRTYLGKAIRAVAMDRQGAMLMGIDINFIYKFAWGIGIMCMGIAAIMIVPIYPVYPLIGQMFVLVAFVVVVLGGLGNFTGALLAGLLLGVVESFSGFFIHPALKEVVYFIIFIVVLSIKPSGLFGLGSGYEEVGLK
jgi:branched-chain amino acid transport system permease protein